MNSNSDILLEVRDLKVSYGNIMAVKGVSFSVRRGEFVTLIGANGAGKSSILKAISGLIAYEGNIVFENQDLKRIPAHAIVAMGISQVPEGRGIFGNLTVDENLRLASWQRKDKKEIAADYDRVFKIFPRLKERLQQMGGTLSGGEQQMLAVGRALMNRPRLMLLDEPSMGLSPLLVRDIFKVLAEINREGTTILLVEQNAYMSLRLAVRAYVLETGTLALSGTGHELLGDPRVRETYLGG
jgi:branched-chain amino acid transport system ATP-binding protein